MANIYARNSHWKWYLAAGGIAIIIISLFYTRYLAGRLEERETQQARLWAEAQRSLTKMTSDTTTFLNSNYDFTLHAQVLVLNNTIPVVLVSKDGSIQDALNVDGSEGSKIDVEKVQAELARMRRRGIDSIEMAGIPDLYVKVYYSHSKLLDLIKWYPVVQLGLIMAFVGFGFLGFNAARRAEENQVWLGMAKETAHQLGTPITAILGWLETLKAVNEDRPDNQEMLEELGKDVNRLELVADRFSKIGALPELKPVNLYEQLEQNRIYMQRRAPRKVTFDFPKPEEHPPAMAGINPPIFDWVLENLLRNALDALEGGVGAIGARIYTEGHYYCIDISDTGKGIPAGKFKTVFKPGYSTKTRGWGLGLSLSKRIIEQYHRGKIFVRKSELGKGTTFTLKLLKLP
jgi:signal transduction histidine kinase